MKPIEELNITIKKDNIIDGIMGCKIFSVCNVKNIICIFYKIRDI